MRALVLGGASGVWDEVLSLEQILGRPWDGIVVAANDVGVHWPRPLDHWVSLHPEKFARWRAQREAYGFPGGYVLWARSPRFTDRRIVPWPNMSSGGLAMQVALEVGATRVALCGVPMMADVYFAETDEQHKQDTEGRWAHADKHWKAWTDPKMRARLDGLVRSMSGRTRELLGAPTREWLLTEVADG